MSLDSFMEKYLWLIVIGILIFSVIVGWILNTNIDPSEIEEEEELKNNTDEN